MENQQPNICVPEYEQVPVGSTVHEMYSVLKMREFRIYFLLMEKINDVLLMLADISGRELIEDRDFKYLYASDIRPIIRKALEDANVAVTTTSIIFPDPVEDGSYLRTSSDEGSWASEKTKQTPASCNAVRNFIRGIAIHLANLAYTPYPDVEFLKRQSAEIDAFRRRCFNSKFEA